MAAGKRNRVVILGGGFAGVYAAKHLERALRVQNDFDIHIINKENYFVFQPMLPEVISGTIGLLDIVIPLRRLLPQTVVHSREVESIDFNNQRVTTAHGFRPQPHVISYDHLVLALGNVTDFRGLRGLPEHALPFKNMADAVHLRNHVIRALEEASIEMVDQALRRQLLTFVVAGGGFSGVEVVAELNDFVRKVARSYRGISPSELRVILLHSGNRILPEVSPQLAEFARKILTKRGVEIRLLTTLAAATAEHAILSTGETMPTRTLISTVPSAPNPLLESLNLPKNERGRVRVSHSLAVEGYSNIWALGDCALVPEPKSDGFCPPTAQHAIRQAETVASNIVASMRGGSQLAFNFAGLGKMGSLGHHSAVAEIMGLKISGIVAWWLWRGVYLMKLPGWGRRVKVASSWTLDFLLPPEITELKLEASSGITEEHFEPGQEIFREGELGDRMYIILHGKAEVIRREAGNEIILAELGEGEYFGEMALMERTTRNATVRCTQPMNTLSIPKREFNVLASSLPQLRHTFEQNVQQRQQDSVRNLKKASGEGD